MLEREPQVMDDGRSAGWEWHQVSAFALKWSKTPHGGLWEKEFKKTNFLIKNGTSLRNERLETDGGLTMSVFVPSWAFLTFNTCVSVPPAFEIELPLGGLIDSSIM